MYRYVRNVPPYSTYIPVQYMYVCTRTVHVRMYPYSTCTYVPVQYMYVCTCSISSVACVQYVTYREYVAYSVA